MNTPAPVARTLPTSSAQLRLAQSRAQIALWLEQGLQAPAASSSLDCAVRSALPLLGSLRAHPGTAVVLGALAQAWLRSGRSSHAGDSALRPLDVALSLARRHPRITLVTVGFTGLALWWWNRSSHHLPPR
ncbi:hypothetical protein [Aquabacterium sp. A08]|uniref:hypothetical protein n=1 Tax=Aquabacterium sp. A08 TaxID=2718532 RepID=UPI001423FE6E|nr:hypothetical protein [Aquabacterium sp. A08]NIC40855.1 hypothetical protein [Aquabacterium sp. A08]